MATPRPLSFADSGRQSPFKRQNSASPATVRATTPTSSPTKLATSLSPTKAGSLSPDKNSPFVRRPSQISNAGDRPSSPFARPGSSLGRPGSSLGVPQSPSRQVSNTSTYSRNDDATSSPKAMPVLTRRMTPPTLHLAREETPTYAPASPARDLPSPSPSPFYDGPAPESPAAPTPSQAMLRPTAQRIPTSSTVSTIRQPQFTVSTTHNSTPAAPISCPPMTRGLSNKASGGYNHVPPPLLRSMRESFEVLDSSNSGTVNAVAVATMLEQMGMDNNPSTLRDFFPSNAPAQLNLARYLDILSSPLGQLSHNDELIAAFEAFDVDDSGQIDVMELRNALVDTAPEPGEEDYRVSEREVDSILGEFASRRHFGAKGLTVAKGKGEVFRYREFMGSLGGGPAGGEGNVGMEGVTV
ncbi:hypothetical protein LTR86_002091 [Recurvomyces mirabilis]|nr:hypothetical protein LTR86_002091 [Recurvomyces mirabilis]